MCDLPGAGKTTVARRPERERPALRLNADDWMLVRYAPFYARCGFRELAPAELGTALRVVMACELKETEPG